MKRGLSVLQLSSVASNLHTHTPNTHTPGEHTNTHTPGEHTNTALDASGTDGVDAPTTANTHVGLHTLTHTMETHSMETHSMETQAGCLSPFPAATSLFSPDVNTKMASDLLIRLSEATQKAQTKPGTRVDLEPQREALPVGQGEQQEEPGLALSPDGPGASPEPPTLTHTLTHTPDESATDTLASDLLRKLAERQEVNSQGVKVKKEEEEEPMEVDTAGASLLVDNGPITDEMSPSNTNMVSHSHLNIKMEDQEFSGTKMADQLHSGAKMADQSLLDLKMKDKFYSGGKMEEPDHYYPGVNLADGNLSGAKMPPQFLPGVKMEDLCLSGAKMEDQVLSGAKMADQCLRAVFWQDMSVNLASTLLHQLSERVSRANSLLVERTAPPTSSSPVLKVKMDPASSLPPLSPLEPETATDRPSHETSLSSDQTTACSYFYRCHVCGFETEGRGLFQGHMAEHRQWERGSFSLHCCVCDHSTNQETEMRAHAHTHTPGDTGVSEEMRSPIHPPAASNIPVAMETQPESAQHRCRICQRLFPGQQELLVHFQGHRQGNQYRCDRCGHLTRTANKLVEHVRVHTGERPFTCDLCPYSAKRRDSLRLHCKVKHPAHAADTRGDVHTHRSYSHGDNQRSFKHGQTQRLHTLPHTHAAALSLPLHPSLTERAGWRDLSPLLSITTLISLKQHTPSSSPSSSSSSSSLKHSFLGYLGLKGSP